MVGRPGLARTLDCRRNDTSSGGALLFPIAGDHAHEGPEHKASSAIVPGGLSSLGGRASTPTSPVTTPR